jgi:hypothetical protein
MTANDWIANRVANAPKRAKQSLHKMLAREIKRAENARDKADRYANKELQREIIDVLSDWAVMLNAPSRFEHENS